tara:strand:+ start:5391 stop:5843 length:453 start_codon:yes stop_codon:yes gene_type:complete
MAYLKKATFDDVLHVTKNMRDMDRNECWLQTAQPVEDLIKLAFISGGENLTISNEEGKPVGLCGVSNTCRIWMVATDELFSEKKDRLDLIKKGRIWVDNLLETHTLLYNFVYAENKPAIKWLKALGFSFINLHPLYGTFKKPFYEFVRIN